MSNILDKNQYIDDHVKNEKHIYTKYSDSFSALSDAEKVLILNSEKILFLEEKINNQQKMLKFFFEKFNVDDEEQILDRLQIEKKEILNEIENFVNEKKHKLSKEFILDLIKEEIHKLSFNNKVIDEKQIVDSVMDFYKKDLVAIEQKLENNSLSQLNDFDKKISLMIEKMNIISNKYEVNQKQFDYQEDKIDFLDNEIKNQIQRNIEIKKELDSSISKYKNLNEKFGDISDLQEYIENESKKIAKDEILNYMETYNLFQEDRENEILDKVSNLDTLQNSEILKAYELQLENNRKLDQLQKLLDEQNESISSLSFDRQDILEKINNLISKENTYGNQNNLLREVNYEIDVEKLLNKEEIEILVKRKAIEIVKEKIEELNLDVNKIYDSISNAYIKKNDEKNFLQNNSIWSSETEDRLKKLENNLKNQYEENIKLKNDLFDEIAKNSIKNEKIINSKNKINDIINLNNLSDFLDFNEESEDYMKHNYYGNQNYIPSTKITRIKNYKYNNDYVNTSSLNQEPIVQQENVKNNLENEVKYIDNLNLSIEKYKELENLIIKQEEEISKLRNEKSSSNNFVSKEQIESLIKDEAIKIVQNEINQKNTSSYLYSNNSFNSDYVLQNIDSSIKKTLDKLDYFSKIQEKALLDIEATNKKIEELESEVKKTNFENSKIINDFEEENARKELERLIEEKYKNNFQKDENFDLQKLEEERKKINDTLELEKIRLLNEIENNKIILNEVSQQQEKPQENNDSNKNNNIQVILEPHKRKRKQQIFYELKTHSAPKLTRADIEK